MKCEVATTRFKRALELAHVRADALRDEERDFLRQIDVAHIAALLMRIATQVSSSGGSIATVNPQPKRDFKRSSSPSTSFG